MSRDLAGGGRGRLAPIDMLRGLAIVLMAVDHSRAFFQPSGRGPEDLDTTTLAFFLTRWITHFCAPTFVLLAGVGARLYRDKVGARTSSRFLASRGLWLMFLEVTWISFAWYFSFERTELGVVWGIGGAMLLLAPLTWMTGWSVGILGAAVTVVLAWQAMPADATLGFFFQPGSLTLGDHPVSNVYVIVPWFAVLALGWGLAPLLRDPARHRILAIGGVTAFLAFLGLRWLNGFGNPTGWEPHERGALVTAMGFMNPAKYPPSLDFQLMTLGPAVALVPLLDRWRGRLAAALETFGRVPLFFYLLHLPLLHGMGLLHASMRWGTARPPNSMLLSLPLIYGAWLVALALLWWPCQRWDMLKSSRRHPLLRYL